MTGPKSKGVRPFDTDEIIRILDAVAQPKPAGQEALNYIAHQPQERVNEHADIQPSRLAQRQGLEGQQIPEMTDEVVERISGRYLELFRNFTGRDLEVEAGENIINRIEDNINKSIKNSNFAPI